MRAEWPLANARTCTSGKLGIWWVQVVAAVTRPYRVTAPTILLLCLVPFYLVIADLARSRAALNTPSLPLDALIPLHPAWSIVYGAMYLFLILLPVLVIHQEEHIRRTVFAYLTVWLSAYLCFVIYPTGAPRPADVNAEGFGAWGLRILYSADPPYNCFPSIHVGHSFVSAFSCSRVQRRLGIVAVMCASLVALSTLFTKQHYALDVLGGFVLASIGYLAFLRRYDRRDIPEHVQRVAPVLAGATGAFVAVAGCLAWVAYQLNGNMGLWRGEP